MNDDNLQNQQYIALIKLLLQCTNGEQINQLLNENQNLLDLRLIQVMKQIAKELTDKGNRNASEFLVQVAEQISNQLSTPNTQILFLEQVLQKTQSSNSNALIVHQFLESNLDLLNEGLIQVLRSWSTVVLNKIESTQKKEIDKTKRKVAVVSTICNFSNLINEFPLGNKAVNLEIAIACYEICLKVYNKQKFPKQWAMIQNNLGITYSNRLREEIVDNLEKAIEYYQAALTIRTKQSLPLLWAKLQNNLGAAYFLYYKNVSGATNNYLEFAIKCYQAALEVYTPETFPVDWAMTQNNLGAAYSIHISEGKTNNLKKAIECYQAALTIRTKQFLPLLWADTQNNLGTTYYLKYKNRLNNTKKDLEKAIECYQAALEVRTRESSPKEYADTLVNLGVAYQETEKLCDAYDAFKSAIDTVESWRNEIFFGSQKEEDKQNLAESWNDVYQRVVEICLIKNQLSEAIEYAERSKTRNLVDTILNRDLKNIFPLNVVKQLESIENEIRSKQLIIQNAENENIEFISKDIQKLINKYNELQKEHFSIGYEFNFKNFQKTLDDRTIILNFYILNNKIILFFITHENQKIIQFELTTKNKIVKWIISYINGYRNHKSHWQRRLKTRLKLLAKIIKINKIIELIPKNYHNVIIIPHRYLHLVPFHAIPIEYQNKEPNLTIFNDIFSRGISFVPSCQLLQLVEERISERSNFADLFFIQNPTQNLTYADLEVQTVKSYFEHTNGFERNSATKANLDSCSLDLFHCVHFSCHGYFNSNPGQANKSALILANSELNSSSSSVNSEFHWTLDDGTVLDLDKCLTLNAIFKLNLDKCRLVVMSACETGLIDFTNVSDEYIGLVSGFLYAGSPSVVSSLWAVDQVSTAFLMVKFYENLRNNSEFKKGDIAVALKKAQNWLRNLSSKEVEEELNKPQYQKAIEQLQQKLSPGELFELEDAIEVQREKLNHLEPSHKPFEDYYYWSAFIATGV